MASSTANIGDWQAEKALAEIGAANLQRLFVLTCQLIAFDALRLKPREKQFCLVLAGDSFAVGRAWGPVGISFPVRGKAQTGKWCGWLASWKTTEIWEMWERWRRAVWLLPDMTEGRFRLCPDRLPGWADAFRLWQDGCKESQLELATENDLHKEVAKLSQTLAAMAAAENARISHTLPAARRAKYAEFPRTLPAGGVGGAPYPNVSETFNPSPQRINVRNVGAPNIGAPGEREIFAFSLKERVRKFVGERDWQSPVYWNAGCGYQDRIFSEEGRILEGCLNFVQAGLQTGEIVVQKNKGALLWNEFQRQRRKRSGLPPT